MFDALRFSETRRSSCAVGLSIRSSTPRSRDKAIRAKCGFRHSAMVRTPRWPGVDKAESVRRSCDWPGIRSGECGQSRAERYAAESGQKLIGAQRHLALLVAVRVIFPSKRYEPIFKCEKANIRNRDPMRVPRKVLQYMLWSAKRPFRMDHPVPPEQLPERCAEWLWLSEIVQPAVKSQLVCAEQALEPVHELPRKTLLRTRTGRKNCAGRGFSVSRRTQGHRQV